MFETTQTKTVGEDGVLRVEVAGLEPGGRVDVTVRESAGARRRPDAYGRYRVAGEFEGKIRISDDFDDPLPEMEPHS